MCTAVRFDDNNGNMFFGRNLDWSSSYGEKVVITPRNYKYNSAFLGENTPKNGAIIGMAVVAENTPLYFDCFNEAGLGIAGLNFPGYASYAPEAVDGKANVAAYEFPLWVAMNFGTVDEAEEALKNVVIVAKPINEQYPVSDLHFIIGDKTRSIVVEYTDKGMQIFHNDVDVLTNQPGFMWHQENLRNYMNLFSQMPESVTWNKQKMTPFGTGSLMRGIPGDYYSTSRFVRVAYFNTHYPSKDSESDNISKLFHILSSVKMIEGAALMRDGHSELTIYTGGYSSASKTYLYNTYENPAISRVALSDYELDSAGVIQVDLNT